MQKSEIFGIQKKNSADDIFQTEIVIFCSFIEKRRFNSKKKTRQNFVDEIGKM